MAKLAIFAEATEYSNILPSPDLYKEGTYAFNIEKNTWYCVADLGIRLNEKVGRHYWMMAKPNKVPKEYQAMALLLA